MRTVVEGLGRKFTPLCADFSVRAEVTLPFAEDLAGLGVDIHQQRRHHPACPGGHPHRRRLRLRHRRQPSLDIHPVPRGGSLDDATRPRQDRQHGVFAQLQGGSANVPGYTASKSAVAGPDQGPRKRVERPWASTSMPSRPGTSPPPTPTTCARTPHAARRSSSGSRPAAGPRRRTSPARSCSCARTLRTTSTGSSFRRRRMAGSMNAGSMNAGSMNRWSGEDRHHRVRPRLVRGRTTPHRLGRCRAGADPVEDRGQARRTCRGRRRDPRAVRADHCRGDGRPAAAAGYRAVRRGCGLGRRRRGDCARHRGVQRAGLRHRVCLRTMPSAWHSAARLRGAYPAWTGDCVPGRSTWRPCARCSRPAATAFSG